MRLLYVALTRAKEKLILVSTVRDLEARSSRAAEATRHAGWSMPAGSVTTAKSWLDWLLGAFSRHRDGWPIRRLGAGDLGEEFFEPVDPDVAGDSSRFTVHVWRGETVDRMGRSRSAAVDESLPWAALAKRARIPFEPDSEVVRRLQAVSAWRYPYSRSVEMPGKVSVTEVARRFEADDGEAEMLIGTRLRALPRPSFEADRPLAPVERGLAVHTFLARLDFSDVTYEGLAAQAERLVSRGILTRQELDAIDFRSLERFFASTLGKRIRAAGVSRELPSPLMRELPFTMRLSASAFSDKIIQNTGAPRNDIVVLQGTIDCLVREGERYLLVDFKTDAVRAGDEWVAARRYEWQVRLYREFVQRSAPRAAVEAHLVFLQTGTAVWVP